MVFKLDGDIIFFLSFDDHFSHQSLAMRAKVQQGPKRSYGTFQISHNASR